MSFWGLNIPLTFEVPPRKIWYNVMRVPLFYYKVTHAKQRGTVVNQGATMFERILKRMWEKVRRRQYVMTLHAEEEMNDNGLIIFDVERCILTGEMLERQKDKVTAEWKYRIRGEAIDGGEVEMVVKLSPTGKLVIITVYIIP